MHCSEYHPTRTRLSQALAAVVLSAGLFPPGANAQMTPPQARPQAQSPTTQAPRSQSPSPTLSDEKLNAAAAAIGQVTSIRQNYERKISKAPPSDKRRLAEEENDALQKAVTDQGLSVDEYNAIITKARADATVRQKLVARLTPSTQ